MARRSWISGPRPISPKAKAAETNPTGCQSSRRRRPPQRTSSSPSATDRSSASSPCSGPRSPPAPSPPRERRNWRGSSSARAPAAVASVAPWPRAASSWPGRGAGPRSHSGAAPTRSPAPGSTNRSATNVPPSATRWTRPASSASSSGLSSDATPSPEAACQNGRRGEPDRTAGGIDRHARAAAKGACRGAVGGGAGARDLGLAGEPERTGALRPLDAADPRSRSARQRGPLHHSRRPHWQGDRQQPLPQCPPSRPRGRNRLDLAASERLAQRRQRRGQADDDAPRLRDARLRPGRVQDRRPQRALPSRPRRPARQVRGHPAQPHDRPRRRPARLRLLQRDRLGVARGPREPRTPPRADQALVAQRPVYERAEQVTGLDGGLLRRAARRRDVADRKADEGLGEELHVGIRCLGPAFFDRCREAGGGPLDHGHALGGDEGQHASGAVVAEQDADEGVLAGGAEEGLEGGADGGAGVVAVLEHGRLDAIEEAFALVDDEGLAEL